MIYINGTNLPVEKITVAYTDYVVLAMLTVMLAGLTLLFVYGFFMYQRIADRYRLKYSFDRELEFKETNDKKDSETRNKTLDRRYKAFLRRTYKD